MRLAVDERDPEVDHREAGRDPALASGPGRPSPPTGCSCVGTAPPTTLSTNSKPEPGRQRLDLDVADRVLAVAAGLLDVPALGRRLAARTSPAAARPPARSPARTPCSRSRSSTTSACASPMHHSTSWWVSALRSSRSVGSPAVSRASPLASASSSERVLARTAIGSSGSGMSHGATSSGVVLGRDGVAGLGAGQLGDRDDVAGDREVDRAQGRAERREQVPDPLVGVVVGVPALGQPVPGDVHGQVRLAACRRRPAPARPARRTGRRSS